MNRLQPFGKYVQGGGMLMSAGTSIYQGKMELDQKTLTEEQGTAEQTVQLLTNMIKQLEQLLSSVQTGSQGIQDQAAGVSDLFGTIISGLSQDLTSLSQAA